MSLSKTSQRDSTGGSRFLRVAFFAAFVLVAETLFFHVLNYIFDYYAATLVISFALLGIGLGAYVAGGIRVSEDVLFVISCLGTLVCLYICSAVTVRYPILWLTGSSAALCFVFPVVYISYVFKNHASNRVYLYDMAGAALGVGAVVLLYRFMPSEGIFLVLLHTLALVGAAAALLCRGTKIRVIFLSLFLACLFLNARFYTRPILDEHNLYNILLRNCRTGMFDLDGQKQFTRLDHERKRIKTYDNLQGRIDIQRSTSTVLYDHEKGEVVERTRPLNRYHVLYDGYANDKFAHSKHRTYASFKKNKPSWPSKDIRLLYGLVAEPRVCIVGSAATGIVKAVKRITPVENILPLEINPGIVKAMTEDFFEQSGRAYEGLTPVLGNAVSILKRTEQNFDIISLLNCHSSRTVANPGPPDYLHTIESYHLYFDRLTDAGYLLFEERPYNRSGELGYYRMLNTLWQCLRQRGVQDPSTHFVIWNWMGEKDAPMTRYGLGHYYSFIVSKQPITGERREKVLEWIEHCAQFTSHEYKDLLYLKGFKEHYISAAFFAMMKSGNFAYLENRENFDSRIVTNDRPFPQASRRKIQRLRRFAAYTAAAAAVPWLLLSIGLLFTPVARSAACLNAYNVLIGFAYFFIEIVLMQVYQNVFVSSTYTFILVLGVLLLGSGIGGLYSPKMSLRSAAPMIVLSVAAALYMPGRLLSAGIPSGPTTCACIILVFTCGFFMGPYFPRGLRTATKAGLRDKIPHFFAINSLAGATAAILALNLAISIGYRATVAIAIAFYILATLCLRLADVARDRPPPGKKLENTARNQI
ncbi:MAG: hypothetical protein HQ559_05850 [Lentisphaerae bacterium]|nr:hypothetical protein [Lentisphaerota bacterium]